MTPRSYLYVPADNPQRFATATDRGADAVIFDLEDSVSPARKASARGSLAAHLATVTAPGPVELWVRVNADLLALDVPAVAGPGVAGVVVPKAEPESLAEVATLLAGTSLRVIALIETARGLLRAEQVAAAPRVDRLGVGEADLIGELGLVPGPDRQELSGLRLQVVLASAAAGIDAPIGPVDTRLDDTAALRASTVDLLRLGFRARTAIHPRQLAVINEVFTPTVEEAHRARQVIDALAEAEGRGSGVAVGTDGRMIDAAVARAARDVLSRTR